jgi:hypothetical protein
MKRATESGGAGTGEAITRTLCCGPSSVSSKLCFRQALVSKVLLIIASLDRAVKKVTLYRDTIFLPSIAPEPSTATQHSYFVR